MTLQELLHLRTADPRRFDALVADKVLGWQWWRFTPYSAGVKEGPGGKGVLDIHPLAGKPPYRFLASKEQLTQHHEGWGPVLWDGVEELPVNVEYPIPNYHADPAADLDCHRVACGWNDAKRLRHFKLLQAVLDTRGFWLHGLPRLIHYQPGDYAVAALSVLEDA